MAADHSACPECGGDTAYEIEDFREFRTCRCCCACGAPDTASVDVHDMQADGSADVEPYCLGCALEAEAMLISGHWSPEALVLRPLPPSGRMLRLGALTTTTDRWRREGRTDPEAIQAFEDRARAALGRAA